MAKLTRSVAYRDLPAAEVNITEGDVVLCLPLELPIQSILQVNLGVLGCDVYLIQLRITFKIWALLTLITTSSMII